MRILLVHNFYGSTAPSGENRVVLEERELLRAAGHEVVEHFTSSDDVRERGLFPLLRTAAAVPWNPFALKQLRRRVRDLDPDVMHVHNVFPLLSPAVFRAAQGTRTAVVNTLHNYRTLCPAGVPMRGGAPCSDCIDRRSTLPALRHGCYRNSRLATLPLAACVALHRRLRSYARYVDAFIALTEFQKSVVVHGGLPADRIHVKPNFFSGQVSPIPWEQREDKCVFLGRISREKGLHVLLKAWAIWGPSAPRLEVIGGGPDLEALRRAVPDAVRARIAFTGELSPFEARARLARARLVIVPSVCFEAFPMVLPEAFALGVPVLASRLGTFEELVERSGAGRLFHAGSSQSLFAVAESLWNSPAGLSEAALVSRREHDLRYRSVSNLESLHRIYRTAGENASSAASRILAVRPAEGN